MRAAEGGLRDEFDDGFFLLPAFFDAGAFLAVPGAGAAAVLSGDARLNHGLKGLPERVSGEGATEPRDQKEKASHKAWAEPADGAVLGAGTRLSRPHNPESSWTTPRVKTGKGNEG